MTAVCNPAPGQQLAPACPVKSVREVRRRGDQSWADEPVDGLPELWSLTQGDPRICIAILDGCVELSHPCFRGAGLVQVDTLVGGAPGQGAAGQHATHVASLIFGQGAGPVRGIAPRCRGISIPIFDSAADGSIRPCSQLDLARALTQAVSAGARIINVSGGQFSPTGTAAPLLARVVEDCARQGILIVAAAGNDGCSCLHIPAALPAVLAVGAMDGKGDPLPQSNWGSAYQAQGILSPGQNLLGAGPGGGTFRMSGTSCATAVTSGVAALLLSVMLKKGDKPDPRLVRQVLLQSARGCEEQPATDCRRVLAGRLNVKGALSLISPGTRTMIQTIENANHPANGAALTPSCQEPTEPSAGPAAPANDIRPAACACQCGTPAQLVYVLGQLGYDLVSEARLDSLSHSIAGVEGASTPERVMAFTPARLLAYLDQHPWNASAVEWTLLLDGTPVYALRPQGPFAADVYKEFRRFLKEQLDEGVERVSIPGTLAGKATLLSGQEVPAVVPELRGMFSWTTKALTEAVAGPAPRAEGHAEEREAHAQKKAGIRNFLDRIYHGLRNLGQAPHDRAMNYAATNAFVIEDVYEEALTDRMDLDSVNVVPSPICRPGSDCWDVEVYFFYPERQVQTVRKVYRFTVDVSDTVPVTVGRMRSWFTR